MPSIGRREEPAAGHHGAYIVDRTDACDGIAVDDEQVGVEPGPQPPGAIAQSDGLSREGPEVHGPIGTIMLVSSGRLVALPQLSGPGAPALAAAMRGA